MMRLVRRWRSRRLGGWGRRGERSFGGRVWIRRFLLWDLLVSGSRKFPLFEKEVMGVVGCWLTSVITGYLTHHKLRYPAAAVLQANVDAYMVHFADQEAARAKLLARQRAVPDEDGFVTVVRGGRAGPARQEEAQEKAEKQKEKSVGKEDFYRFQMREKRKERAGELLKGFEEDRRKVDEMRKRRNKFKPN